MTLDLLNAASAWWNQVVGSAGQKSGSFTATALTLTVGGASAAAGGMPASRTTTTTTQREMPPGGTVCFADCRLRVRASSNEKKKKNQNKEKFGKCGIISDGAVGTEELQCQQCNGSPSTPPTTR